MTIRYDDLDPFARTAVDQLSREGVLLREEFIALLNDFDIDEKQAEVLCEAFAKRDELGHQRWLAARARSAHEAAGAALAAVKALRPAGVHARSGEAWVYPFELGEGGDDALEWIATLERAVTEAARQVDEFSAKVAEMEVETAGRGNRYKAGRARLWLPLFRFWRDDLGRKFKTQIDPYKDDYEPEGGIIDFLAAATINAVPPDERTPQSIRGFYRRNKKLI